MAPVKQDGPQLQSTPRPAGTVRAHIPAWACRTEGVGRQPWEKLKQWKPGTDEAACWARDGSDHQPHLSSPTARRLAEEHPVPSRLCSGQTSPRPRRSKGPVPISPLTYF